MEVCTIIAKNYLAHARVLARSLAQHNASARLWVLVIDDVAGYIDPAGEPFELLTPPEIDCEPFTRMAVRYSVLELSTAVKPWLMRHLLARTGQPVTYLDPDIKVFGSVGLLDDLASEHGLVLIPHNTVPIPADGRRPSQIDVMIAGIYNLGSVSLSSRPEVQTLLDWWQARLERDCRVDPLWGYFVDQRWFDLAPGFVSDLAIVRDPEYNVAYWNIHDRRLERAEGGYRVNGRALAFFHFSGFDPAHPLSLSRHQDRTDLGAEPVLRALLAEYAADVMAEGHALSREWPYTYQALGDGTPIDQTVRRLFDEFEAEEPEAPSPFTLAGVRALEAWVSAQAPVAPAGVSRGLFYVYRRRPDLAKAYTTTSGIDGPGLRAWARDYGLDEEPILFGLISRSTPSADANGADPAPASGPSSALPPPTPGAVGLVDRDQPRDTTGVLQREPFGVNVVGYFRSEVGTGEAARQLVCALDSQRIPVLPIHGRTVPRSRQNHPYETASPEDAPFPINVICMNADMLPEFARQAGADFFHGRYSVGLWFWEVERFPSRWRDSFSLLEEVWAPSAHVARALQETATVPVTAVPIPVAPTPAAPRARAALGLEEERFMFLFSFDYLSVAERKNALGAIAAFRRAFDEGDGAQLVIKCVNSDHDPDYHGRVRDALGGRRDVRLIDGYLSPADNAGLSLACDCYLSLHRAEGFGLGLAEAMWHAKPVVATGYSGNLDFMTVENSLLVEYELVEIGEGNDPYPPDGVWAEPNVEHAAGQMRRLVSEPELAARVGERAARDIRRTHSPAAVGRVLAERLELIRATGRPRPGGWSPPAGPSVLATLPLKLRQGPVPAAQPRGGAMRRYARWVALRAMAPYIAYQQAVNHQLLDGIGEMTRGITAVRREAALELARALYEHRRRASEPRGESADDL